MLDFNPNQPLLSAGDVVGQRYRVEGLVGRGSFAEVHRGVDTVLEREVAIKIMSPQLGYQGDADAMHGEMIERFKREARSIAKLRSPNTAALYDFGSTDQGALYMVMEFIDGHSLREYLDTHHTIPQARVVPILLKCFQCLREAHNFGLIHRDIKPENIMIFEYQDEIDLIRVVDFGIAKAFLENNKQSDLTSDGVLVGTPKYVAPERVIQEQQFPASDIYSMGIVAYEMLVGRDPFPGLKGMQIIRAQVSPDPIELPEDLDVHPELRQIINKTLIKELSDRYGTCSQIIEDLERVHALLTVAALKGEIPEAPAYTPNRTIRTPSVDVTMSRMIASADKQEGAKTEVMDMSQALHKTGAAPATATQQPSWNNPSSPFNSQPSAGDGVGLAPDQEPSWKQKQQGKQLDMDDVWNKNKNIIIILGLCLILMLLSIIFVLLMRGS